LTSVEPAPLTPSQAAVFSQILPALSGGARPILVQGVTGSGKTELYLRAIRALHPDRQALLLVPEVSLTIQLIRHLRERLPFPIAVWHHQLSDGEKFDLWRRDPPRRGAHGRRHALGAFAPCPARTHRGRRGQEVLQAGGDPCYHARDAASSARRLRGRGDPGSATPSLEAARREGVFTLLRLPSATPACRCPRSRSST
jgi:primosomal protein N' (replication factor Y)